MVQSIGPLVWVLALFFCFHVRLQLSTLVWYLAHDGLIRVLDSGSVLLGPGSDCRAGLQGQAPKAT